MVQKKKDYKIWLEKCQDLNFEFLWPKLRDSYYIINSHVNHDKIP